MSTFNKVIPGRVQNNGIVSREDLPTKQPIISSPAHFPDFAMVTPRGPTKRATVSTNTFSQKFGDTTDAFGKFYNPISLAISKIAAAGQSSFSFKRLTANEELARLIIGVTIFPEGDVPNYKRNGQGGYVLNINGQPTVDETTPTVKGVFACTGILKTDQATPVGQAKTFKVLAPAGLLVPENTEGDFYPLFELYAGIGDEYNAMYAAIGQSVNTDWNEVARFVRATGAYPYTLNIGELLHSGLRVTANTTNGTPDTTFTLYDALEGNIQYNLKNAIGQYTGKNVNRPVEEVAAPFNDCFVYTQYVNEAAGLLFKAEYETGGQELPNIQTNRLPKQAIMNLLGLVDHLGNHYHHVVFGGNMDVEKKIQGTRITLNHYLQANGGIFPYADKTGKYPEAPKTWNPDVDGAWVTNVNSPQVVTHKQYWEMTQILLQPYLITYRDSLDLKDVIRNRTSFIWDVGYNETIKDELIKFLAKRKDLIVVLCATEYLRNKTPDQVYSTLQALNTKITMIPESETYQSQACRSAINLWDAQLINEPTFNRFSLNLDLMYAFALAGGGEDGKVYAKLMPDHDDNRAIRIAHNPLVQFENDDPAANNLVAGGITVTPLNTEQYCRPALPSVYFNLDSVLKDLTNIWKCVCVEKILQDTWIQVSGDPQIGREGYVSFVKDNSEKLIRERFGSVISAWEVNPSFREAVAGSKAIMYSTTKLWFGKGYYMMSSVLEAYNEDSLAAQ